MDNKNITEFMECVAKLQTMEFVGLAKLLKVELADKDKENEARPFEEIMEDIIAAYVKSNRKRRRELMKILRSATKGRDYYKAETVEVESLGGGQENSCAIPEEE